LRGGGKQKKNKKLRACYTLFECATCRHHAKISFHHSIISCTSKIKDDGVSTRVQWSFCCCKNSAKFLHIQYSSLEDIL